MINLSSIREEITLSIAVYKSTRKLWLINGRSGFWLRLFEVKVGFLKKEGSF